MKQKKKRTEPPIRIRLKGMSQTNVFHPGDVVSGVVEIQPEAEIKCRGVDIKFGWHTEGKGHRDEGVLDLIQISAEIIHPDSPLNEYFNFTMPGEPWSYSGHLIRIVWSIDVKVDIPWASDLNESQRLVLQPVE